MSRVVIFGNSGAGKSTLAKHLSERDTLAHLDLDTLAWNDTQPPTRAPVAQSSEQIHAFVDKHPDWVIEGCYADLLAIALRFAGEVIFLNPGVATCLDNAAKRPWEPHKYSSPKRQNENLPMLLDWIRRYFDRDDEFSLQAHRALFDGFEGKKSEYRANLETGSP